MRGGSAAAAAGGGAVADRGGERNLRRADLKQRHPVRGLFLEVWVITHVRGLQARLNHPILSDEIRLVYPYCKINIKQSSFSIVLGDKCSTGAPP